MIHIPCSRLHLRNASLAGLLSLGVAMTLSFLRPPAPEFHDEFSKLLSADTFASGRLTNPPHPMWRHFESFHIIQQPTYSSKYPPGPGFVMAVGQRLANQPMLGVWIITGLCSVAFYWLLLAFVPRRWATMGAVILALHPNIQVGMGQTFFVTGLSFLAATLVIGATPRLARRPASLTACMMATGAILLSVSRPYEGFVLCCCCGIWVLAGWCRHGRPPLRQLATKVVIPFGLITAIGLSALGVFNNAVTGDARRMPYQVHEDTYGACPLFNWQAPQLEHDYPDPVFSAYHLGWSMDWYRRQQTWPGLLQAKWETLRDAWVFYMPLPVIGLIVCPLIVRIRKYRAALICCGFMLVASWVAVFSSHRYLAPAGPLLLLTFVAGLRSLSVFLRRHYPHIRISYAVIILLSIRLGLEFQHANHDSASSFANRRIRLSEQLNNTDEKHLMLIEYSAGHNINEEWVYNAADIEGAGIVWARRLSAARDHELVEYFSDRKVWIFNPDQDSHPRVFRSSGVRSEDRQSASRALSSQQKQAAPSAS